MRSMTKELGRLHEILAAARLEHVRYAIRDMAVLAEQVARQDTRSFRLTSEIRSSSISKRRRTSLTPS